MALFGRRRELPATTAAWFNDTVPATWPPAAIAHDVHTMQPGEQIPLESCHNHAAADMFRFAPLDGDPAAKPASNIVFDVPHDDIWGPSPTMATFGTMDPFVSPSSSRQPSPRRHKGGSSTMSIGEASISSSSAASTWSSIHTDDDCHTIVPSSRIPSPSTVAGPALPMVCLGPQCAEAFSSEAALEAHICTTHTHTCKWVGCSHPSFASRDGLIWHVESEHLLVCPCRGCDEAGFEDARLLRNHIAVGHPDVGKDGVKEWKLSRQVTAESAEAIQRRDEEARRLPEEDIADTPKAGEPSPLSVSDSKRKFAEYDEHACVVASKAKYKANLQAVVEKRAKKTATQGSTVVPRSPEARQALGRRLFPCRMCPEKPFKTRDALLRHCRVVHPDAAPTRALGSAATSPAGFFPTPASAINTPAPFTSNPGYAPCTPGMTSHPATAMPLSPLRENGPLHAISPHTPVSPAENKPVPFPLVFEHALIPFLTTFLPRWVGPRHIISVTRGRSPQARRVCITTPTSISRPRKILIAKHLHDLLPESHRPNVSFLFPVGGIDRAFFSENAVSSCWARGLCREQPDDVCIPRNPFYFPNPCMGDSIGISATDECDEATATLGPCVSVGGGFYWLANFHPFVDAYQTAGGPISVEHPSSQDRAMCVAESHDAVASKTSFRIGDVRVTSGMGLQTTRVSHDPYWDDTCADPPLVVTDWALIDSHSSHANILRRFPIDYPLSHGTAAAAAPERESVVRATSAVVPGASVVSSGRTSGYGSGQICEIPAYVSGEENGTQKATREWFIEEAYLSDNEEDWIRGGIGVNGDSGAAVIDAESKCLVGQLWGRNKYWGPGPRHTFFTPIADIFDDIQEKCGQQSRPQLPQYRSEGDCYPVEPPCRACYDMYRNLDSRRSSRVSLQSMVMGGGDGGDGEQDGLTSVEAASELATPRAMAERHPNAGLEEIGMTFSTVLWSAPTPSRGSQGVGSPGFADMRSPYAQTLELDDLQERNHGTADHLRKRTSHIAFGASSPVLKRSRLGE